MKAKHYLISGFAVLLAFTGGFLLANSLNRSKIDQLLVDGQAVDQEAKPAAETKIADLADGEINATLKRARNEKDNFMLQKGLGLALYRFAALKRDVKRLDDVEELLERAYSLNPDDYEVLVAFGNISFDLSKVKKDAVRVQTARELFGKALNKNPKDVGVLTSLASTYLESEDPEPENAIPYLQRALEIDKRNEAAVQTAATAFLAAGNTSKAREYVSLLKEINKANPEIMRLEGRIQMEEVK